jgi:DNA repair exonuclease SbcCD ATPase subunit
MAAEINELLEEGITRCAELADAVDAAMDAIDETAGRARDVAERVRDEGTEASEHLRGLVARLEKAESSIEAARREADGSLEGLGSRAVDLKTEVDALLDRVGKAATQIEEQRTRVDDSLEARMTEARADFQDLAQKTQRVEAEANQRLDQAGEAITGFRSAIDAARAELDGKQEAWTTALHRLEESAHEQASAWVAGLQGLLSRQASAMVNAANVMVDRHNETMDVIKHEFAEQSPQELATALEPLQASLRSLAQEATAREQALASRAEELQAALNGQIPVLTDLRAILEATAGLG